MRVRCFPLAAGEGLRHRWAELALSARVRHISAMSGGRHPDSLSRTLMFAAALFAISLNLLQPLVHAVAMRDGLPRSLWSAWCNAAAAESDRTSAGRESGTPSATADHECCLGLSHAQIGSLAPLLIALLAPITTPVHRPQNVDLSAAFGIRDGPNQPRAPPLLFV